MYWCPFLIAVVVAAGSAPAVRWLLTREGMVDIPNWRSSHSTPIVRGGGLAVACGACVALVPEPSSSARNAVAISAASLGLLGLIDDRRGLAPSVRLSVQLIVPILVLPLLLTGMPATALWTWCFGTGVAVWCAAFVNAFNFMDGINGMAITQALVGGLGLAFLGSRFSSSVLVGLGLAVSGAAVGFAPFNVPRTRMFLGDVGSYFIGCWLAMCVALALREGIPPEVAITPFLVFLLDTGTTLLRRWRRGARLSEAHRDHAYQRLTQLGWSHVTVSSLAGAVMICGTAASIAWSAEGPFARALAFVFALALASAFVLLPDLLAPKAERQA